MDNNKTYILKHILEASNVKSEADPGLMITYLGFHGWAWNHDLGKYNADLFSAFTLVVTFVPEGKKWELLEDGGACSPEKR